MIKELKKKFIRTAMAAISILMIVVLGGVNIFNIMITNREDNNLLDALAMDEGIPNFDNHGAFILKDESATLQDAVEKPDLHKDSENSPNGQPPGDRGFKKEYRDIAKGISEDDVKATRFFIVRVNNSNEIVYTDVSNISSVTEEEAKEYAEEVISESECKGRIEGFIYKISESKNGLGRTIVFLMTRASEQSILSVAFLSVGIGIAAWLVMLAIVVVLSKRAIRPIAENMERQKQFVTDAGHEIKTPLAIIMANADAMELHQSDSKWSRNIKTQTVRLSGLMNELLTLSKMEEGSVKTAIEDVDVSEVVREQIDAFTESAILRGITIESNIKSGVYVKASKEHIIQLVNILVDNAVKYAMVNTGVDISLTGSKNSMIFRIKNSCDTLPAVEPGKLFDRFYRGDESRSNKTGGYGIGLSIASAIVEAYNGSIKCEFTRDKAIVFNVKI